MLRKRKGRTGMETKLPTFDEMYSFLRDYYLHSRFEGLNSGWPNGVPEGGTYAECVARSSLEQLKNTGVGYISQYESRTARVVIFDADLNILNKDEPPAQIQKKAGHLTHVYGA